MNKFRFIFCFVAVFFINLLFISATRAEPLDGYIEFLNNYTKSDAFDSDIIDDFRLRLNADLNGVFVRRLYKEPEIIGLLYWNYDAAPNKYHVEILSEMLLDENYWNVLKGSMRPSEMAAPNIRKILPQKEGELKDLHLALESKQHRKTISSILRNLSDAIERTPDRADELKSAAVEKIFQVIYTPAHYSDYRTAEMLRQNTPPHWNPAEDRDERRSERPPKRGVTQAEEETGASAGTSPWLWAGLITVVVALAGSAISRWRVNANR